MTAPTASVELSLEAATARSAGAGVLRDTLRNALHQRNAIVGMVILGFFLVMYLLAIVAGTVVFIRHRANIERIMRGVEPRVGTS